MPLTLSHRMSRLKASPIRDILSVASDPGMISFAGGLPAQESFPAVDQLVVKHTDLQYGPSEGEPALREYIAEDLKLRGLEVDADQVLILSGSQQGIDLVAKLVVEEGSKVAVESPTYLAALQVFSLFGADYVPYEADKLSALPAPQQLSLLYTNPTFQNPSSALYSRAQRDELARLCDAHDVLLFEDDPYRDLVYEPCERLPVCSLVKRANWIYQSTFSKTLAPGLRLGYLVCSKSLYPHLLKLKQAADLHSSRISQSLTLQLLNNEDAAERLASLQRLYRQKRDRFDEVLTTHFGQLATWSVPVGGLFFWLRLQSDTPINTTSLLAQAIASHVTFMPGEPFFADGREAASCLRLNFSNADSDDFDRGLGALSRLVQGAL